MKKIDLKDYNIKKDFYDVLSEHPQIEDLINYLEAKSNILLFGGSVRDYGENRFSIIPRDFDMVVADLDENLEEIILMFGLVPQKNKFDGYKIRVNNLKIDIWKIQDTWAFKHNEVVYNSKKDLNKTVFLNIDSIFYDLNEDKLIDERFIDREEINMIDIVLSSNPYPELNLMRAFRFKYKYKLTFSNRLNEYLMNWMKNFDNEYEAINNLRKTELNRYNKSIIDWDKELQKFIN